MEIKKYTYQGGEARDSARHPNGVEYMLMIVDMGDEEVELYAEEGLGDDYEEIEDYEAEEYEAGEFYETLKAAIIEQAKEYGIDLSGFDFNGDVVPCMHYVLPVSPKAKMNITELARKYGTVECDGTQYTLTDYAEIDGKPNTFYPRFLAPAIDQNGNEYIVYFRVKPEYVKEELIDSRWEYSFTDDAPEYPDLSDMCDWDKADEVVPV